MDYFNQSMVRGTLYRLRMVIRYHGLEHVYPEKIQELDVETQKLIAIVSKLDDLAIALSAPKYLLSEANEGSKNVACGGFIDSQAQTDQKIVTPGVMQKFMVGEKPNKLTECKTNADYAVFAVTLLKRALLDPEMRDFVTEWSEYTGNEYVVVRMCWPGVKCAYRLDLLEAYDFVLHELVADEQASEVLDELKKCYLAASEEE